MDVTSYIRNKKYIDSKIEEITNNILVLATLSELQNIYPNGTNKPVWITSENAWYFWEETTSQPSDTTAPILTITAGGTFTGTKTVNMSTNESAIIYYTLDGTNPTINSSIYMVPFDINVTTTLKAFSIDSTGNASSIQTILYTIQSQTDNYIVYDSFDRVGALTTTETGQPYIELFGGELAIQKSEMIYDRLQMKTGGLIVDAGVSNCIVEVDWLCSVTGGANQWLLLRIGDAGNDNWDAIAFGHERYGETWKALRWSNRSILGEFTQVPVQGDRVKVRIEGTNYRFFINDIEIGQITSSVSQNMTHFGFETGTPNCIFDNFKISALS